MKKQYYLILVPIALIVVGQSFGKVGAGYVSLTAFNVWQLLNVFTIVAWACLVLRGFVWLVLLRKFDLAFAYPFMSVAYILVLAVSYLLFGEAVTVGKVAGCCLITGGVFCISLGERKNRGREMVNA